MVIRGPRYSLRYLTAADAPADFDGSDEGLAVLPAELLNKLSALALV